MGTKRYGYHPKALRVDSLESTKEELREGKKVESIVLAAIIVILILVAMNPASGQLLYEPYSELSPGTSVGCVDFSRDSTKLASDGYGCVKIWDVSNGNCIKTIKCDYPTVWRVSWSPDGTKLAFSFFNEKQGTDMIDIYNTHSWNRIARITPLSGGTAATSIAWSPDSTKIAFETFNDATYSSHGIKIWDISNKKFIKTISTPGYQQSDVVWSPDGTKIVSYSGARAGCSEGGCTDSIRAYDSITGCILWEYTDYRKPGLLSNRISWSSDSTKLALAGSDGITILDATNGALFKKFGSNAYSIDWSPDGTKVVAGCSQCITCSSSTKVFDIYSGEVIWTSPTLFTNPANSVSWSSDGTKIASCSTHDKSNRIKIYVESKGITPPTAAPTARPRAIPTVAPTVLPTAAPTAMPRAIPTVAPTARPRPTPAPEISIPPLYVIGAAAIIVIILIAGIGISRKRKRGESKKSQPPTEPPKPKTESVKETPPPISKSLKIERAIYDPCKRDFVEGRLPRMKEWINRYDPSAYWFAISIQNNTDRAIEEWGIELETSSALKVEKAIIEGMEYKIELRETHPEPYKNVYAIGVPKEYGIVIPKGGAQRVYFKLHTEKPKTTYEISGIFKSAISGDVPIRAKEFKYLCDTGVSAEAVKAELKKTFSEKDAARLANTFRVAQEIRSSYCNTDTTAKEINKEFDLLKMYLTEKEFLDEIEGIQRRINAELREDERLDEKHVKEVKDFCEKFTEMWIAKFLR